MNDGNIMRTKNKVSDKKIAQKNTCLQTKRQRFLLVLRPKLLARLICTIKLSCDHTIRRIAFCQVELEHGNPARLNLYTIF